MEKGPFNHVVKKVEKFVKNVVPDLLDNFPNKLELPTYEYSGEEAGFLMERLIPEVQRNKAMELTSEMADGTYFYRTLVGSREEGTTHPHDFYIEKKAENTRFYFIDPEHNVGANNVFRPKIGNLMAIELSRNGESHCAILRFRTDGIPMNVLKLKPQYEASRTLIEDEGTPAFLKGREENILYRIVAQPNKVTTQTRFTNKQEAMSFASGMPGSLALEGKAAAHAALFNRFLSLLSGGSFEPYMN
jgi:hypothetical protein